MDNKWQSALTPCIKHLPDCNYYHYSLQLNTYKASTRKELWSKGKRYVFGMFASK